MVCNNGDGKHGVTLEDRPGHTRLGSATPRALYYIGNMSDEILTMLGVGATLLASGGTFALFIFRLFGRLEKKVDDLARDHQSLARELSELRGEIRGRLGDLPAGSSTS